ncbi:MAG: hypothetical protein JXB05_13335 [Myxococcaceae bacterium]|nr:hypothetical protein [Myxococcaceae bacterium]
MGMQRITIVLTAALVLLASWAGPAAAQQKPELGAGAQRPWAQGVPPEKQEAALKLFREGNILLKNSLFPRAAEKYREALKLWDHPAIHYNMALALLNLNEPLALHAHLVSAMRFGEAPLDADKLERARTFKTLVEQQLALVEITCDVPGATVMMDGKELFKAPGRYEGFVLPGQHTFTATKEGYPANERKRDLFPGKKLVLPFKLYTQDEMTRYSRPWAAWKPWAVLGAGAAVALGGGALHVQARRSYDDFDTRIAECGGCIPAPAVSDMRIRGDNMQRLAFGAYAVGGAAFITGAVLTYINRPQAYRVNPDEAETPPRVSVAPLLSGGEGGILATFNF